MITVWLIPRTITFQNSTENVDWVDVTPGDSSLEFPLTTATNVNHIAIQELAHVTKAGDILVFSNFQVPSYTSIQNIEVLLEIRRRARITDYVLQLQVNGSAVSRNVADMDPTRPNISIYSGDTTVWELGPAVNLQDPTFGLLLQVGPHPNYPSSDPAIIDRVALRITYS